MFVLPLAVAPALGACDGGAPAPQDASTDAGARTTDADVPDGGPHRGVTLATDGRMLDATWGTLAEGEPLGPVVLVARADGLHVVSRHRSVAIEGTGAVEDGAIAASPDGRLCAVWADGELRFGCAPAFAVEASHAIDGRGYRLTVGRERTTVWYQQGASAHSLVREGASFRDVELFESSISSIGDAATIGEQDAACLVNSGSRIELLGVEARGSSPIEARGCAIAEDRGQPGVLAIGPAEFAYGRTTRTVVGLEFVSWRSVPAEGARAAAVLGDDIVVLRVDDDRLRALTLRGVQEVGTRPDVAPELRAQSITDGPIAAAGTGIGRVNAFREGEAIVVVYETSADGASVVRERVLRRSELPNEALGADDPFERIEVEGDVFQADTAGGATYFASYRGSGLGREAEAQRIDSRGVTSLGALSIAPLQVFASDAASAVFVDARVERQQWVRTSLQPAQSLPTAVGALRARNGSLYAWISSPGSGETCLGRFDQEAPRSLGCPAIARVAEGARTIFFGNGDEDTLVLLMSGETRALDGRLIASLGGSVTAASQASDRSIWAASGGTVFRFEGTEWRSIGRPTGEARAIERMHALAADDVWVHVGDPTRLHRYDGTSWTAVETGLDLSELDDFAGDEASGLIAIVAQRVYRQRR